MSLYIATDLLALQSFRTHLGRHLPHSSETYGYISHHIRSMQSKHGNSNFFLHTNNLEYVFEVDDIISPNFLLMTKLNPSITDYSVFIFNSAQFSESSLNKIADVILKRKSKLITFSILDTSLEVTLKLILKDRGYITHHASNYYLTYCSNFYSNDVLHPNIQLPNGFRFCDLNEADVRFINDGWDYKDADSLKLLNHLLRTKPTVGIKDDINDRLVCWIFLHEYNAIGVLQTLDEYRRKGLAKACVQEHLRKIRETLDEDTIDAGFAPFAYIFEDNESSLRLFEQLNFKCIENKLLWMQLEFVDG